MVSRKTSTQLLAFTLTACLAFQQAILVAMADSTFGSDWKPTPLVDTSAPAISKPAEAKPGTSVASSSASASAAAAKTQLELETKLKPAEPFMKDVESKLNVKPPAGTPLVQRLNTIQMVLFGEPKYQDAGELLAKLAELFPQEAAKANAELNKQLQSSLQPVKPVDTAQAKGKKSHGKQTITTVQPVPAAQPNLMPTHSTMGGYYPNPSTANTQPTKKKKSIWHDDWNSSFDNDPFFQDQPQNNSQQSASAYANQQQSQGPSRLAAIGQGLAGLALMAGGVAGNYYMNKNSGRGNYYPNNGYYGPGYGNGYYGNPYGAYAPYGATYGAYPGYYGNGYGSPAYYGVPQTYSYTPYGSTYSNSTFGGLSPLGVPTGVLPY